jgi:hypothetical protein
VKTKDYNFNCFSWNRARDGYKKTKGAKNKKRRKGYLTVTVTEAEISTKKRWLLFCLCVSVFVSVWDKREGRWEWDLRHSHRSKSKLQNYFFYFFLIKSSITSFLGWKLMPIVKAQTKYYKTKLIIIKYSVMLTSAPGALVKDTKIINFCIENNVFYLSKKSITQVPK